jgi:hypothetical protein
MEPYEDNDTDQVAVVGIDGQKKTHVPLPNKHRSSKATTQDLNRQVGCDPMIVKCSQLIRLVKPAAAEPLCLVPLSLSMFRGGSAGAIRSFHGWPLVCLVELVLGGWRLGQELRLADKAVSLVRRDVCPSPRQPIDSRDCRCRANGYNVIRFSFTLYRCVYGFSPSPSYEGGK